MNEPLTPDELAQAFAGLPEDAMLAIASKLAPYAWGAMRSRALLDAKNHDNVRFLHNGVEVTQNAGGTVVGLTGGKGQFDIVNIIGGGANIDSATNARQINFSMGGGADCLFDYLVSPCFLTLAGFTEGMVFTTLSNCTFKGYSTVQGAYDDAKALSGQWVIAICGGNVGRLAMGSEANVTGEGNALIFYGTGQKSMISGDAAHADAVYQTGVGNDVRTCYFQNLHFKAGTFGTPHAYNRNGGNAKYFDSCFFEGAVIVGDIAFFRDCASLSGSTWDSSSTSNHQDYYNVEFNNCAVTTNDNCFYKDCSHNGTGADAFTGRMNVQGHTFFRSWNHFFTHNSVNDISITECRALAATSGGVNPVPVRITNLGTSSGGLINGNKWAESLGLIIDGGPMGGIDVYHLTYTNNGVTEGQFAAGTVAAKTINAGTVSNSIFAANGAADSIYQIAQGGGGPNRYDGIFQVTAAPTHNAQEGSLSFDTVANTLYVNTDGATTWAVVGTVGGGSGASTADAFVTIGHPADLPNSRSMVGTAPITVTDGGAGGNVTIAHVATASGDLHTEYLKLAGRAGGQTAIGGTLTAQGLKLQGNAIDAGAWVNIGAVKGSPVACTSAAGTPITITATAHGFKNKDTIIISGMTDAAANGTWVITVTGVNTFTLDGSTSAANGTGGTATPTSNMLDYGGAITYQRFNTVSSVDFLNLLGGILVRFSDTSAASAIPAVDFQTDNLQINQLLTINNTTAAIQSQGLKATVTHTYAGTSLTSSMWGFNVQLVNQYAGTHNLFNWQGFLFTQLHQSTKGVLNAYGYVSQLNAAAGSGQINWYAGYYAVAPSIDPAALKIPGAMAFFADDWSGSVTGTSTYWPLYVAGVTPSANSVSVHAQSIQFFGSAPLPNSAAPAPVISLGGGVGVMGIANATTNPSTLPTGGGVLWSVAASGGSPALSWSGQMRIAAIDQTFTSWQHMLDWSNTITLDFVNTVLTFQDFRGTVLYKQAGGSVAMIGVYEHQAFYQNVGNVQPGNVHIFGDSGWATADAQTITMPVWATFPTDRHVRQINGGAMIVTRMVDVWDLDLTVAAGCTVTNRNMLWAQDPVSIAGTLVNNVIIDIEAQTAGSTLNLGMRTAAQVRLVSGAVLNLYSDNGTTLTGTWSSATGSMTANSITATTMAGNVNFTGTPTFGSVTITTATVTTMAGAVNFSGAPTFAGDVVLTAAGGTIRANTADASDNSYVNLTGGGAAAVTRGAFVTVIGNEQTFTGQMWLAAGDVAGGDLITYTGNFVERLRIARTGAFSYLPSAQQSIAVNAPIVASSYIVQVSTTTAANMTAAPTVADGRDGQILIIINTGTNTFTLQDQGTLASSNLRLSATGVALATRDNITLMYNAAIGDWVQIAQVNVL